jgi:hypothetical protein
LPDVEIREFPDFSSYSQENIKVNIANVEELFGLRNTALNTLQAEFNVFVEQMNVLFQDYLDDFDRTARDAMATPW